MDLYCLWPCRALVNIHGELQDTGVLRCNVVTTVCLPVCSTTQHTHCSRQQTLELG